MVLDRLSDFNAIMNYYIYMINCLSQEPEKLSHNPHDLVNLTNVSFRVMANNLGIGISQNFEAIKNTYQSLEKENKTSSLNDCIMKAMEKDTYLDKSAALGIKNLMQQNNWSPFEVLSILRNKLLHGDYNMEIHLLDGLNTGKDDTFIPVKAKCALEINTKPVKILFDDFGFFTAFGIESLYEYLRNYTIEDDFEINTETIPGYFDCKDEKELSIFLSRFNVYRISEADSREGDTVDEIIKKMKKMGFLVSDEEVKSRNKPN